MSLVGPESPSEQARRVFQSFDPEGNEQRVCMCALVYHVCCAHCHYVLSDSWALVFIDVFAHSTSYIQILADIVTLINPNFLSD